ncbi:sulfite exporter TauE/SafE family protein [Mycobacterium sp. CBMA293]|uniref:sulfite exporter TauE/SafE family protein n=1 Tax=unclassified Mycolicibacterium TaxID=2636767 RepID=UPI00132C2DDC|nr:MULTISPECIES: sulfite exporter TauE/SafE family protein [unclassified Mycolicibacterium]MUL47561.1 sulfite exporter TauE/SafE family protein [Mycolicibacterium sp. CBMA 360]MUL59551.1 sulfite exporter TauE/SafE family protein [Mycolicibacterium sp. CBMA 335]MUL71276.1 sulfite exporter TauE/SafE family protein [Mycolicibacterium sp. CBMA 311]MUL94919.1 sulfite exporter TauE/SafE family protein [Mycolicibacterium sp. CBMA 230]MUM31647.1 sulfite exporter TauE/SafE family protein [Mycolicibacte
MTSFVLLLLAVGVATGITTVLFGFGGGFVSVPAVYAAVNATGGADAMHTAVATSAVVMIVNAAVATVASARRGLLNRAYLWPITSFIALGAVLGALAANWASERILHLLFVAYVAATMMDSIARDGFLRRFPAQNLASPLSVTESTFGGIGIGAVASFLGVGGSVLTVPLLRRKGVAMADATALANPLSLPVAIAGSVVFALAASGPIHSGQIGYINPAAAALLLGGSLPAIALTKRTIAKKAIPDQTHAIVYLVLLGIVLIAMIATIAR